MATSRNPGPHLVGSGVARSQEARVGGLNHQQLEMLALAEERAIEYLQESRGNIDEAFDLNLPGFLGEKPNSIKPETAEGTIWEVVWDMFSDPEYSEILRDKALRGMGGAAIQATP